MRKVTSVMMVLIITTAVLFLVSCGGNEPGAIRTDKPSAIRTVGATLQAQYDLSVVVTVGNHSYVPLNIDGEAKDNVQNILGALDAFEKAHPELEVTSWSLLSRQASYSTYGYTYGIWVNHRPRSK